MTTTVKGTAWSVTINNPGEADEENIKLARQRGYKVEGQKEVGESGTPHYQLLVKTPSVRFSALKKAFPRAHIELAKSVTALAKYVVKEETRVGELLTAQSMYPSLEKTWDMLYVYTTWDWKEAKTKTGEDWLVEFDKFIAFSIECGYVMETMGVNPQIRSAIKKYGFSIYTRSQQRVNANRPDVPPRTDTDRQTDENLVAVNNTTDTDGVQEIRTQTEGSEEEEGSEADEAQGRGAGTG